MSESICFFGTAHIQFLHSEAIFMHHKLNNVKSVLARYIDAYVYSNPKVIDN